MNKSLLMQAKEADVAYQLALAHNAPVIEQARLLELWCRLYCQAARDEASLTALSLNILLDHPPPSAPQVSRPRTHH